MISKRIGWSLCKFVRKMLKTQFFS